MADDMITLTVNGREIQASRDRLLIHVLRELEVRVPTLCHDDRLTPYGGCRLCVVERRDGRGGLVPACSTPVQPGMVIETDTDAVVTSRQKQLQLLVLNHRMECPVCERRGDCRFQDLLYEIGTPEDPLPFERAAGVRDTSSPVIERDPEKCLVCGRCVRLCEEVQGVAAIGVVDRGLDSRVTTFEDRPLDCEFCGQCVNACPVGALVARPWVSEVPPWMRTSRATTCSFCPCGCEVTVETWQGEVVRVTGRPESDPNHGKLCAKGWLGLDVLSSPQRVTTPLVRRNGGLVEATWEEALEAATSALARGRGAGGSVLAVAGAELTVEDGYRLQRLVRGNLGSAQVHTAPVGGVRALTRGLFGVQDHPGSNGGYAELRKADVVLLVRGDPTRTHPLVKTEIVQGVVQRGQRLLMAAAFPGGLERQAEEHLELAPGSEQFLLSGLAALMLERSPELFAPLADLEGAEAWRRSLAPWTLEVTARSTGLETADVERLATTLVGADRPLIGVVTGLGIPGDEASASQAAAALAALLGAGAGMMVLGEGADVQGLVDVGLHPSLLPGHRRAGDAYDRGEIERLTGVAPPTAEGTSLAEALETAGRGAVETLWLLGTGTLGAVADRSAAEAALTGARDVVVQSAFLTEEARRADVVLPVSLLGERRGSVVGWDGIRRPMVPVVDAPAVPGDGQLIAELARRLGAPQPDDEALEKEIGVVVPWPFPEPELRRVAEAPEPAEPESGDGLLLDASPHLFHAGAVTSYSARLQELSPTDAARLHPEEAARIGAASGDPVTVSGDHGEARFRVRVDRHVREGTVVVPRFGVDGAGTKLTSADDEPRRVRVRRS